jgi:hypothetical protein
MDITHEDDGALPKSTPLAYTPRPSSRPPGSTVSASPTSAQPAAAPAAARTQPLAIDVRGIRRVYKVKPKAVVALDGVDLYDFEVDEQDLRARVGSARR